MSDNDTIIEARDVAITLWKHTSKDTIGKLYHPDTLSIDLDMSVPDVCRGIVSLCLLGVAVMDQNGFRITHKMK